MNLDFVDSITDDVSTNVPGPWAKHLAVTWKLLSRLTEKSVKVSSADNPYEFADRVLSEAMAEWKALPQEAQTAGAALELIQTRLDGF